MQNSPPGPTVHSLRAEPFTGNHWELAQIIITYSQAGKAGSVFKEDL